MKRFAIAIAVAAVIYGAMLALGSTLYATGVIGDGATHNDCANFRSKIAAQQGIDDKDVPQEQVKAATQACLDEHHLTKWRAFREEYLLWAAWPALVTAAIFLFWPRWADALHRQEMADAVEDAAGLEPGA